MPPTKPKRLARGRRKVPPIVADPPRADPPPELLTVRPQLAAKMLGIAESTLFKLLRAGEIEAVKPSPNMTLIPMASLRAFIARHRSTPSTELSAAE